MSTTESLNTGTHGIARAPQAAHPARGAGLCGRTERLQHGHPGGAHAGWSPPLVRSGRR